MANYGTEAGFEAYAEERGYTVPPGEILPALVRGSSYIDGTYGDRFSGSPTDGVDQELAWPRTGAHAFGSALADDLIPQRVVSAAYEAALLEMQSPGGLSVLTDPSKRIKRQKVDGAVEREFFEPGDDGASLAPVSSRIDGMLAPLLTAAVAGGIGIWVV